MKKVFKYGAGDTVPEGAVYLNTITQDVSRTMNSITTAVSRMVWHYFLVEVDPS